jgi:hypothetical protein
MRHPLNLALVQEDAVDLDAIAPNRNLDIRCSSVVDQNAEYLSFSRFDVRSCNVGKSPQLEQPERLKIDSGNPALDFCVAEACCVVHIAQGLGETVKVADAEQATHHACRATANTARQRPSAKNQV